MSWMPHLIAAPIILPLFTAALMMLLGEKHRSLKAQINIISSLLGLAIACYLMWWVQDQGQAGSIGVYLPGNWQVPFGIVLVVDRLSALMLVLTGIVGVCALLFAMARWDRAGASFHALFQIQLMGLYGAFLTADLFNLFVFFEVLLAASYGLMLHGSGKARVSAGLHYIAINLLASSLFLIGAAMIYGVTGTLNMADLALKIPLVPEADRGLLHAGAAILATAFLAKAGMWPLNFWLVPAYSSASAPVAALFAIMTKVGFYTLLRLWTLMFSGQAGASAYFGGQWLIYGGLATIAVAAVCILAAQRPGAHGEPEHPDFSRHPAGSDRFRAERVDRCRAVLSGQLDLGAQCAVPACRTDRTFAVRQRDSAGVRCRPAASCSRGIASAQGYQSG